MGRNALPHDATTTEHVLSIVFLSAAAGPGTRAAPLGAGSVVSALRSHPGLAERTRITIVESFAQDDPATVASAALALNPDVLGLSLYSWNSGMLTRATAIIKARLPGCLVVAGGPDASADPQALVNAGTASIVVAGEGERAMVDIVSALLDGAPLPGPIVRVPIADLGALPSPWLDGTLDPVAWGGAAIELTRGCPYRCAFCFESKGEGRLRRFPLERAAAELDRLEASGGVDEVFVLDPTFNADPRRMIEAIKTFREHGPGFRYLVELRAELLSAEQARALATIDCSVQLGLQSSDPAVLATVNRTLDPALFAKKTRLLDEEGIIYGLDLIYGLPGDTLAGFRRSLDYALALGPNHLDVFRLAVLPGTALYDRAAELGLEHEPSAPYLLISAPGFGPEDLAEAERLAKATDLFYSKGRAVMWFRSVAALLRSKPSRLLGQFADYINDGAPGGPGTLVDAPHALIERAQLDFLAGLMRDGKRQGRGVESAARAMLDLVRVSGAWTRALAEGETTELELGWDPEDLLDYATADIAGFAAENSPSTQRWICSPGTEGPLFRKGGRKKR
ncbi:MAG: radical SAM protein [Spirochaetales bacterium]|nr:radical SAM protein [Spirochaetales bacterium]